LKHEEKNVKPSAHPPAAHGNATIAPPREVFTGLLVCQEAEGIARNAARYFIEWAWQSIAQDGRFCVALSGGKTPALFFRVMATKEFRTQVDWAKVHLFWGDERPVPPESAESNYGLARRELLIRVPIPPANVHRMEAEKANVGRAAQDYEDILRQYMSLDSRGFPRFHLIFLGLGPEGHTASLFPGQRGIRETSRWVSTPIVPQVNSRRMTLTLPVLNAAHRALFLVSGPEKSDALYAMLAGTSEPPIPAQMVTLPDGQRTILCDEAAAKLVLDEIREKGRFIGTKRVTPGAKKPPPKK
jgi:6-phosphogluconolactonase